MSKDGGEVIPLPRPWAVSAADADQLHSAPVITLRPALVPVEHRTCGGIAFLYEPPCDGPDWTGYRIEAAKAVLLGGGKPKGADRIICGTCGEFVNVSDLTPLTAAYSGRLRERTLWPRLILPHAFKP